MGESHFGTVVAENGFKVGTAASSTTAISGVYEGSETYDAGSIADGDEEVGELTITGAALGDYCLVSLSIDIADLAADAHVTAADTVTYQLLNNTGGAIDLASATVKVLVISTS